MSGICGYVGTVDPGVLTAMLEAIPYRGDRTDTAIAAGAGLGYRWWGGRPGKSGGIHRVGSVLTACCGHLAPPVDSPAAELRGRLGDQQLDGAFAGAIWDGARLTLVRDPFGVRSLYYAHFGGALYFASELKQLLAIPGFPAEPNPVALHKYLTFSFTPGEDVPLLGVKRVLPGHIGVWDGKGFAFTRYLTLHEAIDPELEGRTAAVRAVRRAVRLAVEKRLPGEKEVGLFLSGGLDSSAVAFFLKRAGAAVRAFSLDFGESSVERGQAQLVARHLGLPLDLVKVGGEDVGAVLMDLVWKLDLPFGDPVTGPQYLLGQAARAAGLETVFSGEGGDQLFGGWTNKPMISAELYGDHFGADSREETYLQSYHRFYGLEDELYTPAFQERVGGPGQRRAHLRPYLESDATSFLNRLRLADINLKGSQNILPRAERMANAWALDARVPLFDRALAELSFRLPPQMKLNGANEKYVLKLAMQKRLPEEVIWRKKYGMSVPITEWALGPLAGVFEELLGPRSLASRGLFREDYVTRLRTGQNDPQETRRRRLGERLWTLAMLEAWLRVFVDGRGKQP